MRGRATRFLTSVAQDLRANPLHVALSVIALTIGIIAIVLTAVSGAVAEDVFVAGAEQHTARATTYAATITPSDGRATSMSHLQAIINPPLTRVGGQSLITADAGGRIGTPGSALSQVTLHLYWGDYPRLHRLPVLSGQMSRSSTYPPVLVVNQATGLTVGQMMTVELGTSRPRVTTRVSAVIADGSHDPGYYVPGEVAEDLLAFSPSQATVLVNAALSKEAASSYLGRYASAQGYQVASIDRFDTVEGIQQSLRLLQTVFLVCGVAALTVSAIGNLNLGLATIRHRSRELSIRRAIGATRGDLTRLVLGTSLVTGLLGAATALAIVAGAMEFAVPRMIDPATAINTPSLPWESWALGCVTGIGTSIVGAVVPAIRASRVEIAAILRD